MKKWVYAGLLGKWLLGDQNEKRVWQWSTSERRGLPWNGKEEKIMGTGCNHHEMMVATKRKSSMNIIHYLVNVISRCFPDSCPSPKIPENKKNKTPSTSKIKATGNQNTGELLPSNPFYRS